MLYLIVGIIIGAAFHEFWHDLFRKSKEKVNQWFSDKEAVEQETTASSPSSSSAEDKPQATS